MTATSFIKAWNTKKEKTVAKKKGGGCFFGFYFAEVVFLG